MFSNAPPDFPWCHQAQFEVTVETKRNQMLGVFDSSLACPLSTSNPIRREGHLEESPLLPFGRWGFLWKIIPTSYQQGATSHLFYFLEVNWLSSRSWKDNSQGKKTFPSTSFVSPANCLSKRCAQGLSLEDMRYTANMRPTCRQWFSGRSLSEGYTPVGLSDMNRKSKNNKSSNKNQNRFLVRAWFSQPEGANVSM